ncbi:hypothetical protein SLEP1_g31840 [Rubroshorea leprosula]|uniref:catalase n=1 Tax=Rubroshorea leprosula TaxID=152421 RepID=A0AAV5KBG8_9ROSI|nr:hypothetical protein SLEP1_g31840 [Rubroshorea leprosula]
MDPYKFLVFSVEFVYLVSLLDAVRPSSAHNSPFFTTNFGASVWNNNSSLTVGSRGPILLEDYHLVEKLANVDKEQNPEHVVHAKGASAKGFFEVTHDISHPTCADFLRAPRVQTPVIVTFSTVIHERGSPETLKDPQGFAVKFYTREAGKAHYVQFHWKPTCGVKCLLEDETIRVGGGNNSHATQDLYDSIVAGSYPKWKLFIQIINIDHEDKFGFDPLDVTKTWPEDILPLQPVGRLVLNKNIDNLFAENEQLTLGPRIIVLGKSISLIVGLRPCLIQGSHMRSTAFGSNTGLRLTSLLVGSSLLALMSDQAIKDDEIFKHGSKRIVSPW